MAKKSIIFYIFIFFALPFGTFSISQATSNEQHPQDVWITIFVHGIINVQPHLTLSNIINFWYDNIENSSYLKAVQLLRDDSYFQQYHAMQGLGLQKIDTSLAGPGYASTALANTITMLHNYSTPTSMCENNHSYYTFGWSGLFSAKSRHQEAELLYDALAHEIELLNKQGINPHIRLIGYSQGGNLVINLGVVHAYKKNPLMNIDQLVLLGVPLIAQDYEGIASPLFTTVYNFYSFGDRVQPIDCLSGGIFLSGRVFKSTGSFILPPHIKQIEYRIKRIAYHKPLNKTPQQFHKRLIRTADPGHTEFWSFGWVHNYRSYFPLYPLPAVSFIPYIIDHIEQLIPQARFITADIRPFEEAMYLFDQKIPQATYKTQFFTHDELQQVRTMVDAYKPLNFNKKIFDEKTNQAIAQAQMINQPALASYL